ncbi:MAG: hypothetical protein ACK2UF_15830, partial [Candidatus Promineifilaceae bacterium]
LAELPQNGLIRVVFIYPSFSAALPTLCLTRFALETLLSAVWMRFLQSTGQILSVNHLNRNLVLHFFVLWRSSITWRGEKWLLNHPTVL